MATDTGAGSNQDARAATARAITESAARLFNERGYQAVTVDEIGALAGISGPAIYRHFDGKADLLLHIQLERLNHFLGMYQQLQEEAESPLQFLEAVARTNVAATISDSNITAVLIREIRYLPTEQQLAVTERLREFAAVWIQAIAGCRPDSTKSEVALLASAAPGVVWSILLSGTSGSTQRRESILTRALVDALLQGSERHPVPERLSAIQAPHRDRSGESDREDRHPSATHGMAIASRREAVLQSAVTHMHARGFAAARIEDIGHAAGVSGAAVYRHFTDKDSLLDAIADRADELILATVTSAVRAAPSERDLMAQLAAEYLELLVRHDDLIAVYLMEVVTRPSSSRRKGMHGYRVLVDTYRSALQATRPTTPQFEAGVRAGAAMGILSRYCVTELHQEHPRTAMATLLSMAEAAALGHYDTPAYRH